MTVHAFIVFVLPPDGPSGGGMVKNIRLFESRGHVTLFAHPIPKYTLRVRVLMTGFASSDLDWTEFTFPNMTAAAWLIFVQPRQWKLSLAIVIKLKITIEFSPALRVMTVFALVQVRFGGLAMITPMALLTGRRCSQVTVPLTVRAFRAVTLSTRHTAMTARQWPACLTVIKAVALQGCDIVVTPTMLRMALMTRALGCDPSVISFSIIDSTGDPLMTIEAFSPRHAFE